MRRPMKGMWSLAGCLVLGGVVLGHSWLTPAAAPSSLCLNSVGGQAGLMAPVPLAGRLAELAQQLQADLVVQVFNAPHITWLQSEAATLQAYARPGAEVAVSQGLATSVLPDDEAYAVLAHEAFHVVALDPEHSACLPIDADSAPQRFEQEFRADAAAQDLLVKVGRNPRALQAFLERLAGEPEPDNYTHPSVRARIERLERAAQLARLAAR